VFQRRPVGLWTTRSTEFPTSPTGLHYYYEFRQSSSTQNDEGPNSATRNTTQNQAFEVWATDSVNFKAQMSIARSLQQFSSNAHPSKADMFSVRAYRESCGVKLDMVRFGAMLICEGEITDAEVENLRIGCMQLSQQLRPHSAESDGLFPIDIPSEPMFPESQDLALHEMVQSHSGKLLDGTVIINAPEIGDVYLKGQILPPLDKPIVDWPTEFIGKINSLIFPKNLVKVYVETDYDGGTKKGEYIVLGVPDRDVFIQCCLGGIDEVPLRFNIRSVADDEGKLAHELEQVERVPQGEGWPLAPAP